MKGIRVEINQQLYKLRRSKTYGIGISPVYPRTVTDYHWARRWPDENVWFVYRTNYLVTQYQPVDGEPLSLEEIAYEIDRLDSDCGLKPEGFEI